MTEGLPSACCTLMVTACFVVIRSWRQVFLTQQFPPGQLLRDLAFNVITRHGRCVASPTAPHLHDSFAFHASSPAALATRRPRRQITHSAPHSLSGSILVL